MDLARALQIVDELRRTAAARAVVYDASGLARAASVSYDEAVALSTVVTTLERLMNAALTASTVPP